MIRSLRSRLTLMYVGSTAVLLAVVIVGSALSAIAAYGADARSELHPAFLDAVHTIADRLHAGRSFRDAAVYAQTHAGRPDLAITVYDGDGRVVSNLKSILSVRDWRDRIALADTRALLVQEEGHLPGGGYIYVYAYPQHLVDVVSENVAIMARAALFALIIALGFAVLYAMFALRPVRQVTLSLQALAAGDFTPKPLLGSDSSEVSAVYAAYNVAAVKVRQAIADRELATANVRTFVSDAGHELRTPLTIIMGYLDAIVEGLVSSPRDSEQVLRKTLSECRRMRGTIEKLIALARLDRETASATAIDVAALVRRILRTTRLLALPLQVDIVTGDEAAIVVADESDLTEAIVNIIDNAAKYAPGSPIDVRLTSSVDVVVVEIADAGPGMNAEDREHAFERFHRGSTRGNIEGSGLGLAIAKRAVQRANGRITLTSQPGRGTTVKLYLPRATDVTSAPPRASADR